MPIPDPNIPFDARGRGVNSYDPHHFSPNEQEIAHAAPIVGPLSWTPFGVEGIQPGAEANELAGYAQPITTHPIRNLHDSKGCCDLAYHLGAVQVSDDGYARPVMRSGREIQYLHQGGPVTVGATQILASGYASFVYRYGTPPTTMVGVSSDPGGAPE